MAWNPLTRALNRPRRPSEAPAARAAAVAHIAEPPDSATLRTKIASLRSEVDDLNLLVDLTREIGVSFGSDAIMETIIRRCAAAVRAEQAVITLVNRHESGLDRTLVRALNASGVRPRFHLMAAAEGWMQLHKEPLLSNDARHDPRLHVTSAPGEGELRSLLCLPLFHENRLIGILSACNSRRPGGFSQADLRLLSVIAGQSAQIIEHARLHEEAQRLEHLREEMRLAREIQVALLPGIAPDLPGYDVAGISVPAETMGGDYYDYFRLDPHRWALWLGDVSGKGLPASLLMANLQGSLRGQIASDRKLCRSMRLASRMLFRRTEADKFSTVFCCILDTRDHTLTYCNAGHERPFHLGRGARLERLGVGGVIMGAFEDFAYQQQTVPVIAGDLLVAYSDGVPDAENERGDPFGDERLADILAACRDKPARAIADAVLKAVHDHVGSAPVVDDRTVVVLKRQA